MSTTAALIDLGAEFERRVQELTAFKVIDHAVALRNAEQRARRELRDRGLDLALADGELRQVLQGLVITVLGRKRLCRSDEAESVFDGVVEALVTAAVSVDQADALERGYRASRNQQLHLYGCCESEAAA